MDMMITTAMMVMSKQNSMLDTCVLIAAPATLPVAVAYIVCMLAWVRRHAVMLTLHCGMMLLLPRVPGFV
jgi:hypothetical protein